MPKDSALTDEYRYLIPLYEGANITLHTHINLIRDVISIEISGNSPRDPLFDEIVSLMAKEIRQLREENLNLRISNGHSLLDAECGADLSEGKNTPG